MKKLQNYLPFLLFSILALGYFMALFPSMSYYSEMWLEQGPDYFYNSQYGIFPDNLFARDRGYLSILPRIVAVSIKAFGVPMEYYPMAYNICALIFISICCATVFLPFVKNLIPNKYFRLILFLCILFQQDHEIKTFINFPYYALIPLLLLFSNFKILDKISNLSLFYIGLFISLLVLSKVYFVVFFIPFVILTYFALQLPNKKKFLFLSIPFFLSLIIQLFVVVIFRDEFFIETRVPFVDFKDYWSIFAHLLSIIILSFGQSIGIVYLAITLLASSIFIVLKNKNLRKKYLSITEIKNFISRLIGKKDLLVSNQYIWISIIMLSVCVSCIALNTIINLEVLHSMKLIDNEEIYLHRNWAFATLPIFILGFYLATHFAPLVLSKNISTIVIVLFSMISYPWGISDGIKKEGTFIRQFDTSTSLITRYGNWKAFISSNDEKNTIPPCVPIISYPTVINCEYVIRPPSAKAFFDNYNDVKNHKYEVLSKVTTQDVRYIGAHLYRMEKYNFSKDDIYIEAYSGNEFLSRANLLTPNHKRPIAFWNL